MKEKTEKERAIERLLDSLPVFRHAVREAKEDGQYKLGILSAKPDGTGKVILTLDVSQFFEDIALAIDAPDMSAEDDKMEAAAAKILSRLW
jgi:phosphoglycolate phosphatase-like HAD superfamily hydrolase